MDIEFADLQEGGGEVCSGFMLRDLAHICEEDLDILASLFFVCFGIKAEGFEAFRPAVGIDLFDSDRAFCAACHFVDFTDGCTGSSSSCCLVDGFAFAGIFEFCQFLASECKIKIRAVCLSCFTEFFLDRFSVFRASFQKHFAHQRVHVVADSTVFSEIQCFETFFEDSFDFLLRIAFFDRFGHAAQGFDLLEFSPDLFSHLFGEFFNRPGAASCIDRAQHAEFFLQHDLQVSSDTAGEFVTFSDGIIIWCIFVGIYATNNSRECFRGIAEHIHAHIENGLGEECRFCMDLHRAIFFFCTESLHDVRPYLTSCTKFCDFNEERSAYIEAEVEGLCNIMNGNASLQHFTDILDSNAEGICDFLYGLCAAQGEYIRSDEYCRYARCILASPANGLCHLVVCFFKAFLILAISQQLCQRACTDHAMKRGHIFSLCFDCGSHHSKRCQSRFAGIHHKWILRKIQTIQKGMYIFESGQRNAGFTWFFSVCHIHAMQSGCIEAYIVYRRTTIDFVFQELIIFLRKCFITRLCNAPWFFFVTIDFLAAHEISHARIVISRQDRILCVRTCTQGINRAEGDPFISLGIHQLIERLALQKSVARIYPFLVGWRCEFIKCDLWEIGFAFRLFQNRFQFLIGKLSFLIFRGCCFCYFIHEIVPPLIIYGHSLTCQCKSIRAPL